MIDWDSRRVYRLIPIRQVRTIDVEANLMDFLWASGTNVLLKWELEDEPPGVRGNMLTHAEVLNLLENNELTEMNAKMLIGTKSLPRKVEKLLTMKRSRRRALKDRDKHNRDNKNPLKDRDNKNQQNKKERSVG